MAVIHPIIKNLLQAVDLEEKEQNQRFGLHGTQSLKLLKAEGLALHPISVSRKNFGYADYPEITFHLRFAVETMYFKDGAAIECFYADEVPVKGILLNLEGKNGEFRLFAPDFPDWIEEEGVGIKLAPDHRTTTIMKTVLKSLEDSPLFSLFQYFHGENKSANSIYSESNTSLRFDNGRLNESQQKAVAAIVNTPLVTILHGPPGTGKTTTLIEGIIQLIRNGEKVLVSAPSNAAVDHIARGLINKNVHILRLGNTSKVDEMVFHHTPEGKLSGGREQKEIKQLKIRAEEFRKMALKYKRSFGKAEREQRQLLFREVKNIRLEIKKLRAYNEDKLFKSADVILGTPIGLYDAGIQHLKFKTLIIDEAGQCIEPLAWCIFPLAEKIVLAGDHWQLPPTVLSSEAAALGLNNSILETGVASIENVHLLDIQYRMRESIAGFSGEYFYKGMLRTAKHLSNSGVHLTFIDTAGSGYNEEQGIEGVSLENEGELLIVQKLLETENIDQEKAAFISPYSAQVAKAKQMLPKKLRISTIDSFQGQESETIIISLVRSNDTGEIGFLKDYRRMNVAITRAKEQLFVIGDSATIGADVFYNAFLSYVEEKGNYRSVWELEM
jgi:superfamily I DNA and/or RNA helicase